MPPWNRLQNLNYTNAMWWMFKRPQNCTHLTSEQSNAQISKICFNSMWTENFQMFKLDLEKAEKAEIKFPISLDPWKSKRVQKSIYFCFIDCTKAFDCVDHNKLWKILKEMGIPDHLTCLLRNLYAGQEATVRTRHGTTGSKFRKEYIKAVYCHPAYLTYMQSTSCEILDWINTSWNQDCQGKYW